MLLHGVIMTSYCCQRYAVLVMTLFQQDSASAHRAVHVQQLNCYVKKRQSFLLPTCGLQTTQISVLSFLCDYKIWAVMQYRVYHRQIHSVDDLKRLLTNGAGLNSRLLTRQLTSGEEDIERMFMLKENISSRPTNCELTMLILLIYVTFSVTCLTVTSLITKSCQQRWPIHLCSFYKCTSSFEVW